MNGLVRKVLRAALERLMPDVEVPVRKPLALPPGATLQRSDRDRLFERPPERVGQPPMIYYPPPEYPSAPPARPRRRRIVIVEETTWRS